MAYERSHCDIYNIEGLICNCFLNVQNFVNKKNVIYFSGLEGHGERWIIWDRALFMPHIFFSYFRGETKSPIKIELLLQTESINSI